MNTFTERFLSGLRCRVERKSKAKRNQIYFQQTMQNIRYMIGMVETDIEKVEIIEYVIQVIGRDIAWSVPAQLLYARGIPEEGQYTIPTQLEVKDKKGFSLSEVNVISEPYDFERLRKAIPDVFLDGFHQEVNNYTGTYYPDINLAVIENGRHHLSAALVKGTGSATLYVFSLKDAFPKVKTDGAYWYIDGLEPWPVFDYRIAVLYETARMKDSLVLPDNVQLNMANEFQPPKREQMGAAAFEMVSNRTHWLELELCIKKYQIEVLKDQQLQLPGELQARLEQLEEQMQKLKRFLLDWEARQAWFLSRNNP